MYVLAHSSMMSSLELTKDLCKTVFSALCWHMPLLGLFSMRSRGRDAVLVIRLQVLP